MLTGQADVRQTICHADKTNSRKNHTYTTRFCRRNSFFFFYAASSGSSETPPALRISTTEIILQYPFAQLYLKINKEEFSKKIIYLLVISSKNLSFADHLAK